MSFVARASFSTVVVLLLSASAVLTPLRPTWAEDPRFSPAYPPATEIDIATAPIQLAVTGVDTPFRKISHAEGRSSGSVISTQRYEGYFSVGTAYGRIRIYEAPVFYQWNVTTPAASLAFWSYPKSHHPIIGSGGKIDHGRLELNYARFQITNGAIKPECFVYIGAIERWQVDGWTCGAQGQFSTEADIAAFIHAIGYPNILTAHPVTLPGTATRPIASASAGMAFDSAKTPTVSDETRRRLKKYETEAGPKALALASNGGWSWVSEKSSSEEAQRLALDRCAEQAKRPCFLYAVDNTVVY